MLYNPFVVHLLVDKPKDHKQLAFIVAQDEFNIIIGKSGHPTLVRGLNKADYEGGWIFLKDKKIIGHSGYLGYISCNHELIKEAIETVLKINFRLVK